MRNSTRQFYRSSSRFPNANGRPFLPRTARSLPATASVPDVTNEGVAETRIYSGEIWTDAYGQATVLLPHHVDAHPSTLEYELEPVDPCVNARRVAGEIDAADAASDRTTETRSGEES